jgi:hypothetical protein
MTPEEKAKDLVDKFTVVGLQQRNEGIQCAIIAVDEIMENLTFMPYGIQYLSQIDYWEGVKTQIKLL